MFRSSIHDRFLKSPIMITGLCLAISGSAVAETAWLPLPEGPIQRVAFGSCAKHWRHQPIWEAVIEKNPDVFLFLGDNIYADTDGKTAWKVTGPMLRGEWNRLADKPEFQKARAAFPFLATWDNHDYGSHAGGSEFPVKEESKESFLSFFSEPENSPSWKRSGIYDAKIVGPAGRRLQIILLDTKYNRSTFKRDPTPVEERLGPTRLAVTSRIMIPRRHTSVRSNGNGWRSSCASRPRSGCSVPAPK